MVKTILLRFPLFLLLSLSCAVFAGGPDIAVYTDRESYNIGDVITITIKVRGKGYRLGDMDESDLAPFELRSREDIYDGESDTTRFLIKGSIFEIGNFQIPPFTVIGGEGKETKSDGISIEIVSLLKNDGKNIRDIKPQVEITEGGPLWPWIVLSLLFIALAALIYCLMKRKKKGETKNETVIEIPPHLAALDELKRIEEMHLAREGRIKELYTLVSDVVRNFKGKVYGIDAMEMTTGEMMETLRHSKAKGLPALEIFLNGCDMVKFAKHLPPRMDIEGLIERARGIVNEDIPQTSPDETTGGIPCPGSGDM